LSGPSAGRTFVLARSTLEGTSGSEAIDRELAHGASLLLEGDGGGECSRSAATPRSWTCSAHRPPLHLRRRRRRAPPLASLAAQSGFEVTLVDHRPAYLTPERFPPPLRIVLRRPGDGLAGIPLTLSRRNFAVVQTHALATTATGFARSAGQPLAYLGLLGPRARKEQVLREVP